jgi:DNA-binding response OmpR family regulator
MSSLGDVELHPQVVLVDVPPEQAEPVRALLEQLGIEVVTAAGPPPVMLHIGDLQIDEGGHTAMLDGRELILTAREFDLLLTLARHAGAFVSRPQLMTEAWGRELGSSRTIDIHVRRLRAKLEARPGAIETRVRVGYRLAPEAFEGAPVTPVTPMRRPEGGAERRRPAP